MARHYDPASTSARAATRIAAVDRGSRSLRGDGDEGVTDRPRHIDLNR